MKSSLFLLGGVVMLLSACSSAVPSASHPMLSQSVSLSLPTDTGSLLTVPNGKTVILDFWAPTCEPCRKKLPDLVAHKADFQKHNAQLVLVAVLSDSESTEKARETLQSWGIQESFLVDRSEASKAQLAVTSLPSTLVVDGNGKLLWSAPTNASADDVLAAIP